MRCAKCNAWATPDMATCSTCGEPLPESAAGDGAGGSLVEKYQRQIRASRDRLAATVLPDPGIVSDRELFAESLENLDGGRTGEVTGEVTIAAATVGVLNLLLLHAGFSPFRQLAVRGPGAPPGARLRITARPSAVMAKNIPLIDAGELEPPALEPDPEVFFALDEAVAGQLDLAVVATDRPEQRPIAAATASVTVHNPNEWINAPGCEAALAGVVTPNAAAVSELVGRLPGDFTAYQTDDSRRFGEEIAAVHAGLRDLGLSYVGVPPSFEGTGQRVLYPDQVLALKRGCCVDLAALTAAVLERLGFNPLLILTRAADRDRGHALSGVWSSEIRAKQPVVRDRDALCRAVAEGELMVWNSTTCCERDGDAELGAAIRSGTHLLDDFEYALDVAACRHHGYKPLSRRA
ncbi:MAG: hypothetical protein GY856_30515 [bacterium]|nr:hypothetical protein [bacterium]